MLLEFTFVNIAILILILGNLPFLLIFRSRIMTDFHWLKKSLSNSNKQTRTHTLSQCLYGTLDMCMGFHNLPKMHLDLDTVSRAAQTRNPLLQVPEVLATSLLLSMTRKTHPWVLSVAFYHGDIFVLQRLTAVLGQSLSALVQHIICPYDMLLIRF